MLFVLIIALILIGMGAVIALCAIGLATFLVAAGVISSSCLIGILTRQPTKAATALWLQCGALSGIAVGFCGTLIFRLWQAQEPFAPEFLIRSSCGGLLAGLVIGWSWDWCTKKLLLKGVDWLQKKER